MLLSSHCNTVVGRAGMVGRIVLLVLAACLCLTLPRPAAAQEIATALPGDTCVSCPAKDYEYVQEYKIANNGQYLVYRTSIVDVIAKSIPNLYSVNLYGGAPVDLSGPLAIDTVLATTFEISPTSARVVYTAIQKNSADTSLYSVPIQGGTSTRLSPAGHDVQKFRLSPSGQWIVFTTRDGSSKYHLYRVGIVGSYSTAEEYTFPTATNLYIPEISITPDSQRVVFTGKLAADTDWGLYSLPLTGTGSQAVCLTRAFSMMNVIPFKFTPDGKSLVYRYIYDTSGTRNYRLYLVPVTGPASEDVMVSGTLPNGGEISNLLISPNSKWLVFIAELDTLDKKELYSVSLVQGQSQNPVIKLNVDLPGLQSVESDDYPFLDSVIERFAISPDSTKVVYLAHHTNPHDMFVVPINGPSSANERLNSPKTPDAAYDNHSPTFLFTPDGKRLIYTATQDYKNALNVYSIPLSGPASASVMLNPIYNPGSTSDAATSLSLSPDGASVFFSAPPVAGRRTVFQASVTGPANAARPLVPSVAGDVAFQVKAVPHSTMVAYIYNAELRVSGYGAVYLPLISR